MKKYSTFVKNKSGNKKYMDLFLFCVLLNLKEQNIFVLAFVPVFVSCESTMNKVVNGYMEQKNKNIIKKVIVII